jgi:signal transduction histidine kinase
MRMLFDQAAPAASTGVVVLDGALCCRQANDVAAGLLGGSPASMLGVPLAQLLRRTVTAELATHLLAQAEAALTAGSALLTRGLCLAPGDPQVDWHTVPLPDDAQGGMRLLLLLVETPAPGGKTELEQQLLGVLGHELRDPLHTISLWSACLLGTEGLTPATRRGLNCVQRVASRATRVVRDFLDIAQTRNGGAVPLSLSAVDLRQVLEQAVSEAQMMFPGRIVTLDLGGITCGRWDADRLTQLVLNLLTNALKHSTLQGRVQVRAWGDDRCALLQVHNAGGSISPALRARLFQPWHVAGACENGEPDGRGLGLFIVHELARALGGELEVESSPEQGTTFTLKLPRDVPSSRLVDDANVVTKRAGKPAVEPRAIAPAGEGCDQRLL